MTDEGPESFDLVDRPWIAVRFLDGTVGEVSLRDVFERADHIREIGGELPTQDFAIIRLLLAILLRALDPVTDPVREWGELWNREATLDDFTAEYLDGHRQRFDLLHPETPFYQVASLSTDKGDVSSLAKLVADVPNGEPFFTTRQKRGVDQLSFAEAARWVVHCQAFDPSGIKSGAVGDPRVKGGKGYPIGTAWAGGLGGILVEGGSLRETLLLNLVLGDSSGAPRSAGDSAVWERQQQTESEERGGAAMPKGLADLFTWQSRRIRLVSDRGAVTGVIIANGDALKPQNVAGIENLEPMTAWRRSLTQEKAIGDGRKIYMPKTHEPSRSLWRGLGALLPQSEREVQRADGATSLPPISLAWIALLQHGGVLATERSLRTRAVGIEYGSQSATVAEIVDDSLAVHPLLLSGVNAILARGVVDALERTDAAVYSLVQLAGNLAVAKGGESDGPRERARESAYFLLDSAFRRWLAGLGGDVDIVGAQDLWFASAKTILALHGRQLVDDAGPIAWVGRFNARAGRQLNSSESYGWFARDLSRTLALSTDPPAAEPRTGHHITKEEARS
jgi:CRISPR system Cascade subunit CasA